MSKRFVDLSRFLSLVLRHRPEAAKVKLDATGWVSVGDLLDGARRVGRELSRADVLELVRTSDKQRFALSEDGERIRANQGHSVTVELGLVELVPPAMLYHGTAAGSLASIMRSGLLRQQRHHVHLSDDVDVARRVGARHGASVVLVVDTAAVLDGGGVFYRSENGVWLCDEVPAVFLSRLEG